MLKIKILIFLSLIKNSFCPCVKDKKMNAFEKPQSSYKVKKIAKLPDQVNECSGIVMKTDSSFWTINDGGGKSVLYEVNLKGRLLSTINIPNSSNIDWEEVTIDTIGNIYIGDFGNNHNKRKDLRIYKYNLKQEKTDTISFSYADQQAFPPEKNDKNFDCEAMFHLKDSLYIVSKNRGSKIVRFYKIPDKPGKYNVEPFYKTYISSMITGAAIDQEHKRIALLSYGKIYFFNVNKNDIVSITPSNCLGFARNAQAEGITFINENCFLVTNEQGKIFKIISKNPFKR